MFAQYWVLCDAVSTIPRIAFLWYALQCIQRPHYRSPQRLWTVEAMLWVQIFVMVVSLYWNPIRSRISHDVTARNYSKFQDQERGRELTQFVCPVVRFPQLWTLQAHRARPQISVEYYFPLLRHRLEEMHYLRAVAVRLAIVSYNTELQVCAAPPRDHRHRP